MNETRFRKAVREAQTVVHKNTDDGGCERACYDCLLSFYNQPEHEFLDRTLVDSWLENLENATLTELSETNRSEMTEERFNELLKACESSFEREVLHTIRNQEFELPDQAQKTVYDGDEPVAKPDFFYKRTGRSVAVFVDGPAHQKDYVMQDDERKRRRLKKMGYRVVGVTDIGQIEQMWENI
jgi:hypothetical protein